MAKLSDKIPKDVLRRPGVYAFGFKGDPRAYVGSSKNVRNRLLTHRSMLRTGLCPNWNVKEALLKLGFEAARYVVLEYCDSEAQLEEREAYWASLHKTFNKMPIGRAARAQQAEKMKDIHAAGRRAWQATPEYKAWKLRKRSRLEQRIGKLKERLAALEQTLTKLDGV